MGGGVRVQVAPSVKRLDADVGEVLAVSGDDRPLRRQAQGGGGAGRLQGPAGGLDAVGVQADGDQSARRVGDGVSGGVLGRPRRFLLAQIVAIQQQADARGVGIDADGARLSLRTGPGPGGAVVGPAPAADLVAQIARRDGVHEGGDARAGAPHDTAVIALRLARTDQVEVAAAGHGVGERADEPTALVGVDVAADARLAQIIQGGPYEVADDVGVIQGLHPGVEAVGGEGLGLGEHAIRVLRVVGREAPGLIIVAGQVQVFQKRFQLVAVGVGGLGDGPGRVERADFTGEQGGTRGAFGSVLLGDLVADAPQGDAWVAAVPEDHRVNVGLPGGVEEPAVVLRVLAILPAVERLIHDQEALSVAGVQEGRRGWIVAGADGVEPGALEEGDAPLLGLVEGACPEGAVVVVDAAAAQLQRLAVQQATAQSVERERPDAERRLRLVHDFAADGKGGDHPVECGRVWGPEMGPGHRHLLVPARPRGQGDGLAPRVQNARGQDAPLPRPGNRCTDAHGRRRLADAGRGDVDAPLGDMSGRGRCEPDVAVDARTGVPAAGLAAGVCPDSKHVGRASKTRIRGQVEREPRVAVGVCPQQMPVEPDRRVHVNTVEGHAQALAFEGGRQHKRLTIPADAALGKALRGPTFAFGIERAAANGGRGGLVDARIALPVVVADGDEVGAVALQELCRDEVAARRLPGRLVVWREGPQAADLDAVDEGLIGVVYLAKQQEYVTAAQGGGDDEPAAIPAEFLGEVAGKVAAPVGREGERLPGRIVKGRLFPGRVVAQREAPRPRREGQGGRSGGGETR